jgi:hypothetical protein
MVPSVARGFKGFSRCHLCSPREDWVLFTTRYRPARIRKAIKLHRMWLLARLAMDLESPHKKVWKGLSMSYSRVVLGSGHCKPSRAAKEISHEPLIR